MFAVVTPPGGANARLPTRLFISLGCDFVSFASSLNIVEQSAVVKCETRAEAATTVEFECWKRGVHPAFHSIVEVSFWLERNNVAVPEISRLMMLPCLTSLLPHPSTAARE